LNIGKFFTAIKDGAWHSIDELSEQFGIQTSKLAEFSKFLSDHGILEHDWKTNRVKIEPKWKLLLLEENEPTEPETTLATFIIPPETSIDVQSTHISNISNVEIEISLRINNRIKEVAIKI